MYSWVEIIKISLATFELSQTDLASHLNCSKSVISRIANGKQPSTISAAQMFDSVFDPANPKSPAAGNTERHHLETLKDIISIKCPNVKKDLAECWEESSYQIFVMTLLERAKQRPSPKWEEPPVPLNNITNSISLRHILPNGSYTIGRERELKKIEAIFANSSYAVLTGIGGIGKSQIALTYAHNLFKKSKWTIQHIICEETDNLKSSILKVQFEKMLENKTMAQLDNFRLQLEKLRDCSGNALIILDNLNQDFTEEDHRNFQELISTLCSVRILITSRNSSIGERCNRLEINPLGHRALLSLYEYNRFEDSKEHSHYIAKNIDVLKAIFSLVERHTLAIILIAKLAAKGLFSEEQIYYRLSESFEIREIKINSLKDGKYVNASLLGTFRSIFDMSSLNDTQKNILRIMALMPTSGINFAAFLYVNNFSERDITELVRNRWVIQDAETLDIRMHPVISATILSSADMCLSPEECNDYLNKRLNIYRFKYPETSNTWRHLYRMAMSVIYRGLLSKNNMAIAEDGITYETNYLYAPEFNMLFLKLMEQARRAAEYPRHKGELIEPLSQMVIEILIAAERSGNYEEIFRILEENE